MIISLDKLINIKGNKYVFTKATGIAIDRKDNIREYPHEERGWKVVPNVLHLMLDGKIKFTSSKKEEE